MMINPFEPSSDHSLIGTAWSLAALQGEPILPDSAITARFSADGRVAGNAGCNDYAGAYDLGEETIAIGPLRTTRKFCQQPEGLMEQERLYLAALQAAATYRIDGRTLELRTAEDAMAVQFRRAAGEPATDQGRVGQ